MLSLTLDHELSVWVLEPVSVSVLQPVSYAVSLVLPPVTSPSVEMVSVLVSVVV